MFRFRFSSKRAELVVLAVVDCRYVCVRYVGRGAVSVSVSQCALV